MFQHDWQLVCLVRARRPAGTLPHRFRELLALRCGLQVTNYMVGESLSSRPAVRWLQAAIPCIFIAASCYYLGTGVCAITIEVFTISLGVYAVMLGVFTCRTLFKIGGNTSIIRKTRVGKTSNFEPLSHREKTEFQYPKQSTHMCMRLSTKSAPAIKNSKWNSSARLTCWEVNAFLHFSDLLRGQSSSLH